MKPAISVCVPTYNGTKYLHACLDSILAQTFEDFEIILVDDHSSDGTFDLAQDYARRDVRVRLFRNPQNLGMVGNWNRCFDMVEGDWIKFVFQDDRIMPQCLEVFHRASRRDIPLMVCQREYIYDGVSASARDRYEKLLSDFHCARLFPDLIHVPADRFCTAAVEHLTVNFVGEPISVMFHRDVVQRFGRFNPDFIQLADFEYWARIASHTGFVAVPETLASFRVHDGSMTAKNEGWRYFRYQMLDPLLLIYEYAYDSRLAPMRRAARRLGLNLRRIVTESACQAATMARRDANDPLIADRGPLQEWNMIVSRYPALGRSIFIDAYRIRDGFDRHVLWRFRRVNLRLHKKNNFKLPIILAVDIEPDSFFTDRAEPIPWNGYEIAYECLTSLRSSIAVATGSPAHFFWTLRMDPQVAETYGSPEWAIRYYEKNIQACQALGDEIGVHTHAYRWEPSRGTWVVDHGNQPWVDHCVVSSFTTFRKFFGKDCRSFRFGDGWMSNATMGLVEKLGAHFDLTLEPGQEPHPAVFLDKPFTGSLPDLRGIPVSPYRPDRRDFTRADPLRREGIWIIPLSAGPLRDDLPVNPVAGTPINKSKYQTLNLTSEPPIFHWILHYLLAVQERPYLTLVTRSDAGSHPRLLHNVKANMSTLIRHPMAPEFVFCTPAEAMARLGCLEGAERVNTAVDVPLLPST